MVVLIAATISGDARVPTHGAREPSRMTLEACEMGTEDNHPSRRCHLSGALRPSGDNAPDRVVADLAADELGVLSHAELLGCGLTRDGIRWRARSGRIHRLYEGVYAVGHEAISLEGRFLAAVKACAPAVLSRYAAAAEWGFVEWDGRYPQVMVCDTTPRTHPGIRVHRTKYLDPKDVRHKDGIPLTSPGRTLLDLATDFPYPALRRAARQAISMELVSVRQLVEILRRLPKQPGAGKLRRIVAQGAPPTRSDLEDAVLDLILEAGLPAPDVNRALWLDGRKVVPDFRWPEKTLVVEADSRKWHDNELAREDDAERQALLEAHGERVIRITWKQAFGDRARTKTRLLAANS
jgi:very-short-patch-repair endonuclease